MEALTAVSVACLTIYDMIKAVERGVRIEGIHLVEKKGGKSGHYRVTLNVTRHRRCWREPSPQRRRRDRGLRGGKRRGRTK